MSQKLLSKLNDAEASKGELVGPKAISPKFWW